MPIRYRSGRASADGMRSAVELLECLPGLAVVATDREAAITYVSPGAERILDRSAAELRGTTLYDLLGDVGPLLRPTPGGHLVGDCSVLGSAPLTIVEVQVSELRGRRGQRAGYVCVATDVTDLRRAMQRQLRLRGLDRLLVDNLPGAVVGILDADLRWLALGGERLTGIGHDPNSTVGRPVGDGLDDATAADIRAFYRAAQKGPMHRSVERGDGRWLEIEARPLIGPDGSRVVLSLSRDVTDRRAAERSADVAAAALARSEARFRAAFDSAPIGMMLVSAAPGAMGRCVGANAALARIVGRSPQDLVGSAFSELVDEDAPAVLLNRSLVPGEDRRFATRLKHSSGHATAVELVYSISSDAAGAPVFIVQIEDMAARRATEVALLDALEQQHAAGAALAELEQARDAVVSTASHELRTPLTAVGGVLQLLADGDAGELTPRQQNLVGVGWRNVERLADLIDNLVLLTKLDRPKRNGSDLPVDLGDSLRRAGDVVSAVLERRGQELRIDLPDDPLVVLGDAVQIDLAIGKLLGNASDFSHAGTQIRCRIARIVDSVVVSVADSGVGIPVSERSQVFERFFRGAPAHALGLPGTGLGLCIARSIARRHGGDITVETEWGLGSTFQLILPLTRPDGFPATSHANHTSPPAVRHVA